MQAIKLQNFGGLEQMVLAEVPTPLWRAGEVLLEVYASGVNRLDLVQRQGLYPPPAGASEILGVEVAGIIVDGDAAALQAAGLAVGDRVCAILAGGGYAQYVAVAASNCLPLPNGLTFAQAAALPEAMFTVWSNLFHYGQLQHGQSVLIQGGSSGIGVAAIQMAKVAGCYVVVTAGSDAKCRACVQLGADRAVNYKQEDFVAVIKEQLPVKGVDVILDMVAGSYVAREVQCLNSNGKLLIIAFQGGRRAEFDAARALVKNLTIRGTTLRGQTVDFKAYVAKQLAADFWPAVADGRIKAVLQQQIAVTFSDERFVNGAQYAHHILEQGQHVGKIVLTWKE